MLLCIRMKKGSHTSTCSLLQVLSPHQHAPFYRCSRHVFSVHSNEKRLAHINMLPSTGALATSTCSLLQVLSPHQHAPFYRCSRHVFSTLSASGLSTNALYCKLRQYLYVCTVNCSPPSPKRECDFIFSIFRPASHCNSKICDCSTAKYAITRMRVFFLQYSRTFIPRLLVILAYFCSITLHKRCT
jgi:hypothetical protein